MASFTHSHVQRPYFQISHILWFLVGMNVEGMIVNPVQGVWPQPVQKLGFPGLTSTLATKSSPRHQGPDTLPCPISVPTTDPRYTAASLLVKSSSVLSHIKCKCF